MDVSVDKKNRPLDNGQTGTYGKKIHYPTVCVALNVEIPDDVFNKAMAELDLKINSPEICSEIKIEELQ